MNKREKSELVGWFVPLSINFKKIHTKNVFLSCKLNLVKLPSPSMTSALDEDVQMISKKDYEKDASCDYFKLKKIINQNLVEELFLGVFEGFGDDL